MDKQKIRDQVSDTYRRAVGAERKSYSCCCGGEAEPKGTAVRWAAYDRVMLETLPADARSNAFGCGNPFAFMEVQPGETVLDLGCGAGMDLLIAAQKVGPGGRVIGVDMTDEMVERARRNVAEAGFTNVEVRTGIIEELPVDDGSVDWVISNCVINLSPEKEKVFAEMARVLKPGGRISVSDIVAEELPEWVRNHPTIYGTCVGGAISEEAYLEGLAAHGIRAEVTHRLPYDGDKLRALFRSELAEEVVGGSREDLERAARDLENRVASAQIQGAKKAGGCCCGG